MSSDLDVKALLDPAAVEFPAMRSTGSATKTPTPCVCAVPASPSSSTSSPGVPHGFDALLARALTQNGHLND